jgi:hypothetical protein
VNGIPYIPLTVFQPSHYLARRTSMIAATRFPISTPRPVTLRGVSQPVEGRDDRVDVDDLPFLGFGRLTETARYIGKRSMARQPLAPT